MANAKNVSEGEKKAIPIAKGLFQTPSKEFPKGYLIGGKCKKCGEVYFPKPHVCFKCKILDTIEEIPLSTRGKLWSFSESFYEAPGSPIKGTPWVGGLIKLPEGNVYVRVRIADIAPDAVTQDDLDREMELVFETFGKDDQGNGIVTFKFKFV